MTLIYSVTEKKGKKEVGELRRTSSALDDVVAIVRVKLATLISSERLGFHSLYNGDGDPVTAGKGRTLVHVVVSRLGTKHLLRGRPIEGVDIRLARVDRPGHARLQSLRGRAREARRRAVGLVPRARGDVAYGLDAVRGAQLEVGAALVEALVLTYQPRALWEDDVGYRDYWAA